MGRTRPYKNLNILYKELFIHFISTQTRPLFLHIGLKERIKRLVLNTCKPWLTGVIYQSVFTRCHADHSFYITSDSTGMGKEFLLWKSEGKRNCYAKKENSYVEIKSTSMVLYFIEFNR